MIQNTGYVKIPGGLTLELVDSLRLKWGILELMSQYMLEPSDLDYESKDSRRFPYDLT